MCEVLKKTVLVERQAEDRQLLRASGVTGRYDIDAGVLRELAWPATHLLRAHVTNHVGRWGASR